MRFLGRALLVSLVVCLLPAPGEGALMDITPANLGTLAPGSYGLSGSFSTDNDIAVFAFHLDATSTVTAELTSFLCTELDNVCEDSLVRGFDPVLTLLSAGSLDLLGTAVSVTGNDPFSLERTLGPGDYLLTITQFDNFYLGGGAFEHDDLESFTAFFFDPEGELGCVAFIAIAPEPECRNNSFAGTLTVQSTVVTPEPATVTLLAFGGAVLVARRRHRHRRADEDTA